MKVTGLPWREGEIQGPEASNLDPGRLLGVDGRDATRLCGKDSRTLLFGHESVPQPTSGPDIPPSASFCAAAVARSNATPYEPTTHGVPNATAGSSLITDGSGADHDGRDSNDRQEGTLKGIKPPR